MPWVIRSTCVRRSGTTFASFPAEADSPSDSEALDASQKQLAMYRGIHHLVLVLLIVDMVFKPGL